MIADGAITQELLAALRRVLGSRWEFSLDGAYLEIRHSRGVAPYSAPRRNPAWRDLVLGMEMAFAERGVRRDNCLPLRWGRDTELAISAVQALDPFIKDGRPVTHRRGFLVQPVVRFTGERDAAGSLLDGYLTSFVNVSRVEPICRVEEYATAVDDWLFVLSRLGFHARHLSFFGHLKVWRRREVAGVTLMFRHRDLVLGDIVLLWNAADPRRMAVDLGSGLERLAWARTLGDWNNLVFGDLAGSAPRSVLDALRTATLLVGSGIAPAARGAGSAVRRLLGALEPDATRLGVSSAVRSAHDFWAVAAPLPVPWHATVVSLERELARSREPADGPALLAQPKALHSRRPRWTCP
ncbi:hypothetical protein [Jiangella gansuensis]|uniref:hypothetical protein n=1 Tax=Jiangella gansuensis TaxID=281473 RepID=UPI001B7F7BAF|nr:hypothetical protein [Jiangella gansuensis]